MNNVPKLRFSEFEGEWVSKRFGELYTFRSTNSFSRDNLNYYEGLVKNIHYGDIHTKFKTHFDISNELVPFINNDMQLNKLSLDNYCKEGDLIIADASEDYADIGKAIEIVNLNSEKVVAGLHTLHARPNIEEVAKGFSGHVMKSDNLRLQIKTIAQGTKVLSITTGRLSNTILNLPTLPEQTKIANFLTAVDEKLIQLKKKKSLLEQYKKGVMQKLFLQELRFKDENGNDFADWDEKKLGDMISLVIDNRGKTPPTIETGIPLLEVNSIGKKEINYKAVSKYVTNETYNNWFRKYLEKGDILFSTVGNTALCSYFDGSKKAGIAQNIVGLRFKNELSLFMYYLLIEERNRNKFKQIEMGAVQPSIKVSQMVDLYFDVPTLPEQTKIANFLSAIDDKVNHCGMKIEKMDEWEKGLLQRMFV
jgi:type I restriction enzyme S subunit